MLSTTNDKCRKEPQLFILFTSHCKLIVISIFPVVNSLEINNMYLAQILFNNLIDNKITLFMVLYSLIYKVI